MIVMPKRSVLALLLGLVLAVASNAADDKGATVVLEGYSDRLEGADDPARKSFFHFSKGAALANRTIFDAHKRLEGKDKAVLAARFRDAYDIFYDADHGIVANTDVPGWEVGVGDGGIIDMGETKLADVKEAPKDGYKKLLKAAEVLPGHTYCVRTASGKHYGKFHIVSHDKKTATLKITWAFQPDGSHKFK